MNLRRLEYFLAVYEHGSLGRAALELNLTQPALSKSLQQLERELGVTLFDRTPRGLVPTVYAETLSHHARSLLSELRNAKHDIALLSGAARGEISVGVTPSIAATVMPVAAAILHRERPGIELAVIEGLVEDLAPALRRGELDLSVGGWARGLSSDLKTEVVFDDTVRVFARAGHPLESTRFDLPDLLEFPWVMAPHTQFWLDHLDRAFFSAGLTPPHPAMTSNSANFITTVLTEGDYLTYLPSLLVRRACRAGELVALTARPLAVRIDVNITYKARSVLPGAASAFIEALRKACALLER